MSALKKIAARAGRVAAVTAVTVGLAAGLATTPASAAPAQSGATLTIYKPSPYSGYYKVYINGVFPMSQADAQGYINNLTGPWPGNPDMVWTGGMQYHLYGDDTGSNDAGVAYDFQPGASLPGAQPGRYLYAAPDGLRYHREFMVAGSSLNEDRSWYDEQDEIYADAVFLDGDMGARRAYSNVVVRYF